MTTSFWNIAHAPCPWWLFLVGIALGAALVQLARHWHITPRQLQPPPDPPDRPSSIVDARGAELLGSNPWRLLCLAFGLGLSVLATPAWGRATQHHAQAKTFTRRVPLICALKRPLRIVSERLFLLPRHTA